MDQKEVEAIRDHFSGIPIIPGVQSDQSQYVDNLREVYDRVGEYTKTRRNTELEKRELIIMSISELRDYFVNKTGPLYQEDKIYTAAWVDKFSNFFIRFLSNEEQATFSKGLKRFFQSHLNSKLYTTGIAAELKALETAIRIRRDQDADVPMRSATDFRLLRTAPRARTDDRASPAPDASQRTAVQRQDLALDVNQQRRWQAHFFDLPRTDPLSTDWASEEERMRDPCGKKGYALAPWK